MVPKICMLFWLVMAHKDGKYPLKTGPSGAKSKGMSTEDKQLWRHVSAKVKPISSDLYTPFKEGAREMNPEPQVTAPFAAAKPAKQKRVRLDTTNSAGRPTATPLAALNQALHDISARSTVAGLDRNSSEKLRRGKMAIEGRVDLHGFTRREAHRKLKTFIVSAQRSGKRCVLVITGKGSSVRQTEDADYMGGNRKGVLKEEVPRWLREPDLQPLVIDFRSAQPRHGGGGALYVLLRRARSQERD